MPVVISRPTRQPVEKTTTVRQHYARIPAGLPYRHHLMTQINARLIRALPNIRGRRF